MNRSEKIEFLALLAEKKERNRKNHCRLIYETFYDWQQSFCAASKDYHEICLCAANQIGKTRTGTCIDAMHLLGEYPDDYPGHRFENAPLCWALGYSMEKTRDLLQRVLFGEFQHGKGFAGGLIPKERILTHEVAGGTTNAMRTVRVLHSSGNKSVMQFWSYSQGQHAIMGDVVDWVHVDEEPRDQSIRPQILTRTINGDNKRGGRVMYTFTPENGRTDLVVQFMDTPSNSQFFMKRGWSDAPHMTPEKRERLIEQYPTHQRAMRSEGEPMLGHGRIYDIQDDFVLCEPFDIPPFWKVICANDFGWDHPQGLVKLAYDPDADILYVVNSWKARQVSANDAFGATKHWAKGVPVAWPHDGLQHEKGRNDSVQLKSHYVNAGFKMLPEHATWIEGGNSVEAGIYEIIDRSRKGKFRIFDGQPDLMEEWRQYHRDENGKIVKIKDDLLDPIRYGIMMLRFAVSAGSIGKIVTFARPKPIAVMGRR